MGKSKLKCTSRFPRTFYVHDRSISTWYQRWTIVDTEGNFIKYWDITEGSHLSQFLGNLLGHRESFPIDDKRFKILESVFEHSNRWKIFQDATRILNAKGSRFALRYLEDKFAVIRLVDKLVR